MVSEDAPTALVVEDDFLIRMEAVSILQDAGFRTIDADCADDAVTLLEEHARKVTLLFTDVEMPGSMNGFALARHVAAHWPDIGIVVASGRLTPAPGELPEGACFIGKPFNASLVRDRVAEILPDGKKPEPLKRS